MKSLLLLLLLILSIEGFSQSPVTVLYGGDSPFKGDVSWSLGQDSRGFIWSGPLGEGVCAFNGNKFYHWTEDDGLAGNIVNAYSEDKNGNMWFGCQGKGLSVFDGRKFYNFSMADSVGLNSDLIMSIHHHSSGDVLLGTFNGGVHLYRNGVFKVISDSLITVYDMVEDQDGVVWMVTRRNHLLKWDGKGIEQIILDEEKYSICLDVELDNEGRVLVASKKDIYRYDPKEQSLYKFSEHIDLSEYTFFSGVICLDDSSLFCTADESQFLIKDGEAIPLHKHLAIASNIRMTKDRNGNIWSSTNGAGLKGFFLNGIEKYSLTSGYFIRSFSESPSGNLYALSVSGIWQLHSNGITRLSEWDDEPIPNISGFVAADDQNFYISCSKSGLYHFNNESQSLSQINDRVIYKTIRESDSTIIMARQEGWARYNILSKELKTNSPIEAYSFVSIASGRSGEIYLGGFTDGRIVKIHGSDTIIYDETNGLDPNAKTDLRIGPDGRLWFLSINGEFGVLENGQFQTYGPFLTGESNAFLIDQFNDIWITNTAGILKVDFEDGQIEDIEIFGAKQGVVGASPAYGQAYKTSDERLFFPKGSNSIYALDPELVKDNAEAPSVYIEKVMGRDYKDIDEQFYQSYNPLWGTPHHPVLSYEQNNISFNLGAVYYSQPDSIKYQYRLVGFDDEWSSPQESNFISFTNLSAGDYEFQFKAITPSNESEVTTYEFKVLTPWHQSWWFYSILIIGGALIIYFIVRLRIRKLEKDKQLLEQEVAERTKEVVEEKEKVSQAYDELEEKNQEILDSIAYAKRIQSAILPPDKMVKESLPQSFIVYLPKDIVAGDFYWLEKHENSVLFAAADCTGHGVPGAMVSVVCNNGLNRSVREYGITDPAKILDKTRELVIAEFEKSEEEVKDGMDIALCSIEGNKVKYAGAHNPLWVVKKDAVEVLEIKANKQPIGKFEAAVPFDTHELELDAGDIIYIFSDGYADQFGGEKGKKLKSANFRKFLLSIKNLEMNVQKEKLIEHFQEWRGDLEQLDDVCVIGVRV